MEMESISSERYYLTKLDKYLNYGLSSSILFVLTYLWDLTLVLAIPAATIFTVYMVYVFIKEKKIAWITWFIVTVITPFIFCIIVGLKTGYLGALLLIPLGFFYFYCFMLKFSIKDRLSEVIAKEELQLNREEEWKELQIWQDQLK